MSNIFSVLLYLATVIAVGAPTVAPLDVPQAAISSIRSDRNDRLKRTVISSSDVKDEERFVIREISPPDLFRSLRPNASRDKWSVSYLESQAKEMNLWIQNSLYHYNSIQSQYPFKEIATTLTEDVNGDKKLYDALREVAKIKDPNFQEYRRAIRDGLFAKWKHSNVEVKQVFEWIKADFDYALLSDEKAADKLFNDPSLGRLINYAIEKDKSSSDSSVAAVLAGHFTFEKLTRMIEIAELKPTNPSIVHKVKIGLRHYIDEMKSTTVPPASFTSKSSPESQALGEKSQLLRSKDAVDSPVKSTSASPPLTKLLSNSLLARFRRYLSALWVKLRAKLKQFI